MLYFRQKRTLLSNSSPQCLIQTMIALLNQRINKQINTILHDKAFQALEASWRGLFMLCQKTRKPDTVVRLLNISEQELSHDLLSAITFEHTLLFKKIYSEEFDHPGGIPYSLLIGDYYFTHLPSAKNRDPIGCLSMLSKIAAAAFAPFIASISPTMLGADALKTLKYPFKLDNLFKQKEYHRFQMLRQEEDSRFIGLLLPRILMRKPMDQAHNLTNNRFFTEEIKTDQHLLWGNPAYAYGCVVMQSFQNTGWFAHIKGMFPFNDISSPVPLIRDYHEVDHTRSLPKTATEIYLTDEQEKHLHECGFIALKDHRLSQKAVFYSSTSIHLPYKQSTPLANTHETLANMLHYLLCASRFAHYIKVMVRDKVGQFLEAVDCQTYLRSWLLKYCAANSHNSEATRARYPLSEASVAIAELPGLPGKFTCAIYLKPHYQLDQIQTQLKLTTHLRLA